MANKVTIEDNNGKVFTTDKFMGVFLLNKEDTDGALNLLCSISNLTPKEIYVCTHRMLEDVETAMKEGGLS